MTSQHTIVTNWQDGLNIRIESTSVRKLNRRTAEFSIAEVLDAVCREVAERISGSVRP